MFKRNNLLPKQKTRRVRAYRKANVFSYYASRSESAQGINGRNPLIKNDKRRLLDSGAKVRLPLKYLPSLLMTAVILFCLIYVTGLNSNVKLRTANEQQIGLNSRSEYEDSIAKMLEGSIANKSKLLIDTDKIASAISAKYPELGNVSIIMPLIGRRLVVKADPSPPGAILATNGDKYILDENGRIIANAGGQKSSVVEGLPIIIDESKLSLKLGNYALSRDAIWFVQDIAFQLKNKKLSVQNMTLPADTNELRIKLQDSKYYIKFDLNGDSRVQAGTFIALNKKLSADNIVPDEYVDVRVAGKAYYK